MIFLGDCRQVMRELIAQGAKAQACVTSPPYFGLRDYNVVGQIGLEETVEEYVAEIVGVFDLVHELLNDDGTLWLNLGDSYCTNPGNARGTGENQGLTNNKPPHRSAKNKLGCWLKPKDLIGIPWRVAFALQARGWYLRSDIIWNKPNTMPESVTDRPTRSHEYIFLLSKSRRYYYDWKAIKEQMAEATFKRLDQENFDNQTGGEKDYGPDSNRSMRKTIENMKKKVDKQRGHSRRHNGFNDRWDQMTSEEKAANGRNKRDVWTVATSPYKGAHFATFPPDLIEPCVLAGSRPKDIVLDPFSGSGTTGLVSHKHGREYIGIELNPEYNELADIRTSWVQIDLLTSQQGMV